MKNKKGFTLIELIVVIAIIAVMAGVLVPLLIGFVKDAKISQANANAKNIHTSAFAWLAEYVTDGTGASAANAVVIATVVDTLTGTIHVANDVDLSKGMGSGFKGWWGFSVDSSGQSVTVAVYSKTSITTAQVKKYTKAEQEAMTGEIIGCYPRA